MLRGARAPGLWELKPTLLAGTKGSPPLPPAPATAAPGPPRNKRGHGALIPRQRYKWWPPTPKDEAGTNGTEKPNGTRGEKEVIKGMLPTPQHNLLLLLLTQEVPLLVLVKGPGVGG
ncbi:hypothetical protein PBY51_016954 [Eleginops maclovinus]|nr:hypothetical protein PBY51_016954 [Eleginops maclovinus]